MNTDKYNAFNNIVNELRDAFKQHRKIEDNGFYTTDEGTEDEVVSISWNWCNSHGVDENLELSYFPARGEATYCDNGGEGDLPLEDGADWLIKEYVTSDGQDEDCVEVEDKEKTETEKMREYEDELDKLVEKLENLADKIEALDGEKLWKEWEESEDDEGYDSDAPYEFGCAIRYAIEQIQARYECL